MASQQRTRTIRNVLARHPAPPCWLPLMHGIAAKAVAQQMSGKPSVRPLHSVPSHPPNQQGRIPGKATVCTGHKEVLCLPGQAGDGLDLAPSPSSPWPLPDSPEQCGGGRCKGDCSGALCPSTPGWQAWWNRVSPMRLAFSAQHQDLCLLGRHFPRNFSACLWLTHPPSLLLA